MTNDTMAGKFRPGSPLRRSRIRQDTRVHAGRRPYARPWHRRHNSGIQRHQWHSSAAPYQQMPARIDPGETEARVHKSLIIRTHSPSKALMQNLRRAILDLAPDSAVFGISMVEQTVSKSATPWRFICQVLELFAAIALILAVIGIYGVISYSVRERSHELG